MQYGCIGLELYCNTANVLQVERHGWLAVSQYSRTVLWLGKGLLAESRYKICIVTEVVGWLGAGLSVRRRGCATGAGVGAGARRHACWGAQGSRLAGGRQTLGAGRRTERWARAGAG